MVQITMAIAVTSRAEGKSGKKSANVIPNPAMTARPTNGCRGAPSNFIYRAFRLSKLQKASRNRIIRGRC